MVEYGLFNDEGCVERNFYDRDNAVLALTEYDPENELRISVVCPEHGDQEADYCEECESEKTE